MLKKLLLDENTLPGFNDSGAHLTNMAFFDGNLRTLRFAQEDGLATVARQMTATVTVEAVDLKAASVTIRKDDGSRSSFKVENKKHLEGLKAGDRVLITYTMALGVSVTPGK